MTVFLFSCTQMQKQNQMKKDAEEYLEVWLTASDNGLLGASKGNGFVALFNIALNSELRTKKIELMQKYQGDDLIKFKKILRERVEQAKGGSVTELEWDLLWGDGDITKMLMGY